MYVCTYLYMYVCMYVYMVCTNVDINSYKYKYLYTCICTYARVCRVIKHAYVYMYAVYAHTKVKLMRMLDSYCRHACIRTYMHTCLPAYKHTYILTHIHAYLLTYVLVDVCVSIHVCGHARTKPRTASPPPPAGWLVQQVLPGCHGCACAFSHCAWRIMGLSK